MEENFNEKIISVTLVLAMILSMCACGAKNIEIVIVDSIGRATALSSGTVDAVFWTRTNEAASTFAEMSEEERAAEA